MKKMVAAFLLITSAAVCFGQDALDGVIEKAGKRLSVELKGKYALLLNVSAPDAEDAGKYITYGLQVQLVKNKGLGLVDRSGVINEEIVYQLSGSVSDETVQSIANQTGAEAVIFGSLEKLGSSYQLNIKAVNIGTTGVPYAETFKIRKDKQLSDLLGEGAAVSLQIAEQIKELEQITGEGQNKKPKWFNKHQEYGVLKYEGIRPQEMENSKYTYKVFESKGTSEAAAINAVRRNLQRTLVEEVSAQVQSAWAESTESKMSDDGFPEDVTERINKVFGGAAASVPIYEDLEQWTDSFERSGGRTGYTVCLLIRVSKIEMQKAIASAFSSDNQAKVRNLLTQEAKNLLDEGKIPPAVYNYTINNITEVTNVTQVNQTMQAYIEVGGF
jgi:TolB-like protein